MLSFDGSKADCALTIKKDQLMGADQKDRFMFKYTTHRRPIIIEMICQYVVYLSKGLGV